MHYNVPVYSLAVRHVVVYTIMVSTNDSCPSGGAWYVEHVSQLFFSVFEGRGQTIVSSVLTN